MKWGVRGRERDREKGSKRRGREIERKGGRGEGER